MWTEQTLGLQPPPAKEPRLLFFFLLHRFTTQLRDHKLCSHIRLSFQKKVVQRIHTPAPVQQQPQQGINVVRKLRPSDTSDDVLFAVVVACGSVQLALLDFGGFDLKLNCRAILGPPFIILSIRTDTPFEAEGLQPDVDANPSSVLLEEGEGSVTVLNSDVLTSVLMSMFLQSLASPSVCVDLQSPSISILCSSMHW